MKILSGEKLEFDASVKQFDIYSPSHTLFFVTKGALYFGDRQISVGQGYFVSARTRISCANDGVFPCAVYRFDLQDGENGKDLRDVGLDLPSRAFTVASAERAFRFFDALCDTEYVTLGDAFDTAAASMLLSLVIPPSVADSLPDYGNEHINRATRYIEENLSSVLRVEALAQTLGLDRMYLRNLFVKHTGMSTMDYIMTARINRAKRMLTDHSATISSVSRAVGYADVLCFSKAFKKFTGMSPSDYRADAHDRQARAQKQSKQVPVFIL